MRTYPLVFSLLFVFSHLFAAEIAGVDLESLERPSGISLNSQDTLKEQRLKRDIRDALREIDVGQTEANTKDEFSKLLNATVDKSDVRKAGEVRIAEGEAMLKKAAGELQEIYAAAQSRAQLLFDAENNDMLHEWTSTDGRSLSASFVSMSDDSITVMISNGNEFVIPFERLVPRDLHVARILDSGRGFNASGFLETIASGNTTELDYFIDAKYEPPMEIHGEAFSKCLELEQSKAMLQGLIGFGLNVNSFSEDGTTPLSKAIQMGKLSSVRILLQADADPMIKDTAEPELSAIVWSLHKWDPAITTLVFLKSKEKAGDFLASLADIVDTEYFQPIPLETAKKLQEIVDGKERPRAELQALRLSMLGLELTISDLEKVMIAKELRPLVISYHTLGFYRPTIRRTQEFIRPLLKIWEEQSAAGEHAASYSLALAHLDGWGDLKRPERAEGFLKTAIEGEHTPSMVLMGEIYEKGILGDMNPSSAYQLYLKAAGLGDPMGMVKLGHCFEDGVSVDQDFSKAIAWYERSIENGSTEGMAQLGRCYINGIGVRKEARRGLKLYIKAAEANNLTAMCLLGEELLTGIRVRKDTEEGLEWLKRAAEFGALEALLPLGIAYSDGTVKEDLKLANAYFKEAAERGDVEAMRRFAKNLQVGAGVPQDKKAASRWLKKAGESDHLEAD